MIKGLMKQMDRSTITVSVGAPVRVGDWGGWTDIRIAEYGKVLCLSVWSRDAVKGKGEYRGVEAIATVSLASGEGTFKLKAPDVGKRLVCSADKEDWDKADLIEATMSASRLPKGINTEVVVRSRVIPKGSSVGSSASVSVVLASLIDFLSRLEIDPDWVARICHEVETKVMGIECGVQDQAAAAHAFGANFIDIYQYPNLKVSKVVLAESMKRELESRMLTIVYGGCHSSSDVHKMVIAHLKKSGRHATEFQRLRQIPEEARFCLLSGDYVGLGMAMRANTEAQRTLHEELISPQCRELIDFCQANQTLGEKVNGAGGPQGGSLTVLCGGVGKQDLVAAIHNQFPGLVLLEHKIADQGLKVNIR